VVAGDDHASHTNTLTETFDNARRDIAAALEAKGFSPANLRQFSVRPDRYTAARPERSDPQTVYESLRELAAHATGGCLIYFTSHGTPQGVIVGEKILPPPILAQMVDRLCGPRPTVVIVSACFSGVFTPALKGQNRMVLTAARRDRSSFGCSESDKYPFFDDCLLKVLPAAADFPALGPLVRACVARREHDEGARPPSEPQFSVGNGFRSPPFARPAG